MQTRNNSSQTRPKGSPGSGLLTKLFTVLVIAAFVTFGITLFFRVETIQISGLEHLAAQDVLDASGIQYGDSMLLINKSQVASQLKVRLPYVQQVKIHRQLPGTIRLELTEAVPTAVVAAQDGTLWLIGQDGTPLETIPAEQAGDYVQISGFQISPSATGELSELEEADQQRFSAALELLSAIADRVLSPAITAIDLTDLFDIDLFCGERFQIRIGSLADLDYKLQYLQAAMEQLTDEQSGVIDLTFSTDRVARFIPW